MSVSKQNSYPIDREGRLLHRRKRRDRGRRVSFFVSTVLHGLGLAALVYLTPVRELVQEFIQQVRPEQTMSAASLEDLAEAIAERAADQIERNTAEMDRVLGKMHDIHADMSDEFVTFDADRRQSAARDAAAEMEKAVAEMDEAARSIGEAAPIETTDRHPALAEQAQERAADKLNMAQFDVAAAAVRHRDAQGTHQSAKSTHDAHRDRIDAVVRRRRELATQHQRGEQILKSVQKMRDADRPEQDVEREVERLAGQERITEEAAVDMAAMATERDELLALSVHMQGRALDAQKEALAARQQAIEEQGDAPPEAAPLPPPALELPPDVAAAEGADVPMLYDGARLMEDRIAESFKEVRALDLAMVRDMELSQARGDIDVVRPVRPGLDAELLREAVRTGPLFEAHKEELRKALRETNSMVRLAHRMLEMSTQSAARLKFGTDAPMREQPLDALEFQLIIRELAMEEVSGRFSDMAAMMLAAEQAGESSSSRRLDYEDLTGALMDGPLPMFGADDFGMGDLPELTPDVPAVGARKISAGGEPGNWMFIDSWWTLGPFPNPGRINIDREFPPDSLVDLDASYVGKGGRTIRWQFVQSEMPEIVPADAEPYGIWYAYTEFYCDRPRDVIIAMGTDDRGELKINGIPVWISSKQLKGWDIDEVWRRVHFNQGVNRILFRVENGWVHIGFSMTLLLED